MNPLYIFDGLMCVATVTGVLIYIRIDTFTKVVEQWYKSAKLTQISAENPQSAQPQVFEFPLGPQGSMVPTLVVQQPPQYQIIRKSDGSVIASRDSANHPDVVEITKGQHPTLAVKYPDGTVKP